jgi:hypothetical protein
MSTTVDAVKNYLERDLVLHEGLVRGILSFRRTARWLIEKEDWEASEEAVVSALRRYAPPNLVNFEEARKNLGGANLEAETGLVILTLPHVEEILDRLPHAWTGLSTEDTFAVLPGRKKLRIVTEEEALDGVIDQVDTDRADYTNRIAALRLRMPEDGPEAMVATSIAIHVLGCRGKEVLGVFTNESECTLLVPADDFSDAYQALSSIVES